MIIRLDPYNCSRDSPNDGIVRRSTDKHFVDNVNQMIAQRKILPQIHGFKITKAETGSIKLLLQPTTDLARQELEKACNSEKLSQFVTQLINQVTGERFKQLFLKGQQVGMQLYIQTKEDENPRYTPFNAGTHF